MSKSILHYQNNRVYHYNSLNGDIAYTEDFVSWHKLNEIQMLSQCFFCNDYALMVNKDGIVSYMRLSDPVETFFDISGTKVIGFFNIRDSYYVCTEDRVINLFTKDAVKYPSKIMNISHSWRHVYFFANDKIYLFNGQKFSEHKYSLEQSEEGKDLNQVPKDSPISGINDKNVFEKINHIVHTKKSVVAFNLDNGFARSHGHKDFLGKKIDSISSSGDKIFVSCRNEVYELDLSLKNRKFYFKKILKFNTDILCIKSYGSHLLVDLGGEILDIDLSDGKRNFHKGSMHLNEASIEIALKNKESVELPDTSNDDLELIPIDSISIQSKGGHVGVLNSKFSGDIKFFLLKDNKYCPIDILYPFNFFTIDGKISFAFHSKGDYSIDNISFMWGKDE